MQNHHHTVKFHELEAVKNKGLSKEPSLDDNLIVHGDNLVALKALLPTYAGKVKCIYIDPPYNTGNEHWVYNDNVSSPMIQQWLGKEVAREDLSRHDKWCSMMYPRLTLLRELLQDDGVIFISIDDTEVHNLRAMLDEIFGEKNFIATICWQKRYSTSNDTVDLSTTHDFILAYAKERKFDERGKARPILNRMERTAENNKMYKNPDNDPRGLWRPDNYLCNKSADERPNLYYPVVHPKTGEEIWPKKTAVWRYSKEKHGQNVKDNRVWWGLNGTNKVPAYKRFLSDVGGVLPSTWWTFEDAGHNDEAKKELAIIFHEQEDLFDTPKPVRLIKRLVQLATDDEERFIVLDSFAGSGTTAHAVLDLNIEDSGERRFILVECEDYADKLTAERVRRVSKGVKGAKDEKLKKGLGGTFSYYELGKPIDIDKMLEGDDLPSYANLAHYAFFTATGETFDPKKMKEKEFYIGSSSTYEVFMLYAPDAAQLREMALNLDFAEQIEKKFSGKAKLVFAPACFLEEFDLRDRNIRFAQLPFEIYRLAE
ncbi:site-specific DNA-methyltransferase [Candidatus Peregrinibacteria bacterium CG10_big_fil_rev_8_21_14_0_10_54_7]|nr:MAG: site-specific DNA-methyltransferase [Candidatus Peregrinibacteria bacterium CG10_big_fil_rev_8_21_14_0_10_54_7]